MKLWEVSYETDGNTVKAPGVSETQIKREKVFYAAEDAQQVWDVTEWIRADPERRFFSLTEVLPEVTVLAAQGNNDG